MVDRSYRREESFTVSSTITKNPGTNVVVLVIRIENMQSSDKCRAREVQRKGQEPAKEN